MSYILIFLSTLFIATRKDVMYENITGVSTLPEYHLLVVVYTIVCAFYFAYQTYRHFQYLNYYPKYIPYLIVFTTFIMCIGAICPYSNDQSWLSQLHVYASMISSLFFIVILQVYTHYLSIQYPSIYIQTHWIFHCGLQVLIILFIVSGHVSGILEILYVFFICLYLFLIDQYRIKGESLQ